jgi:hypothetical protein
MRTVAQILSAGIGKVEDLRESLQLAAQLEFSTIAPSLTHDNHLGVGFD